MTDQHKIGLIETKWRKGTIAFEVAVRIIDRTTKEQAITAEQLANEILGVTDDRVEVKRRIDAIKYACAKLRADDPYGNILLAYKTDPDENGERKYYNMTKPEDIEKLCERETACAFGKIRRVFRNKRLVQTPWKDRKAVIEGNMKDFEEKRRKLAPIAFQEPEQKAEELIAVIGNIPGNIPDHYDEDGMWICPECGVRKRAHLKTKHMQEHRKTSMLELAEGEKDAAVAQLEGAEDKLLDSFAAMIEKEDA